MRRKYQLTRNRVQLQNRLEALLEEAHIKLSSLVSDLLGVSARRRLKALGDGETNPAVLAAMADKKLREGVRISNHDRSAGPKRCMGRTEFPDPNGLRGEPWLVSNFHRERNGAPIRVHGELCSKNL